MKVQDILKIYVPYSGLDWMNYEITPDKLTIHHIIKKCDGGKRTTNNLAILMEVSHQYLHLIEHVDIDTYKTINKILKEINTQKHEPYDYQRQNIEELLQDFEYENRWTKDREGKLIIKAKYKKRNINN